MSARPLFPSPAPAFRLFALHAYDRHSMTQHLGEYRITQTLTPDQSYLAMGPGHRQVVLKMLDSECLQRDQLHPNIRDRLARVRELAHAGVANLLGVERCDGRVFMVWQYVEGNSLDRHIALTSPAELSSLAREIILAVESLHALGIIHGQIHAGNIIIDNLKQVKLTHVSPLLYDDPANDLNDLIATFAGDAHLAKTFAGASSLAQLRMRLSADAQAPQPLVKNPDPDISPRRKALAAAMLAAVIGIAIAVAVVRLTSVRSREKLILPPIPPQAFNPPDQPGGHP